MKTKTKSQTLIVVATALLGVAVCETSRSQNSTAFTYSGHLSQTGQPANGEVDLRFRLFVSPTTNVVSAAVTNAQVLVSNGVFITAVDFGSNVFTGRDYWLELGVRPGGASVDFSTLDPRQPITRTPYALWASQAAEASSAQTAVAVSAGAVTNGALANGAVTTEKIFDGTIGLSDLSAPAQNAFWQVGGNGGTSPLTNFLGTRDNQPLELKVNQSRALRLEPGTESVNVLGGSRSNSIASGATGVTIAGGGQYLFRLPPLSPLINPNEAGTAADYAVIAGGYGNRVDALASTIAGGYLNKIQAGSPYASIGGGRQNTITNADLATISGGWQNVIESGANYATVGGGYRNTIQTDADRATLGGGYGNTIQTNADYASLGGGSDNTIQTNAQYATLGGGSQNTIQANAYNATLGGGYLNIIQTNAQFATLGGGFVNIIQTNAQYATIGGGDRNSILSQAIRSTISGGLGNTIGAGAEISTIGGGYANHIQGNYATIPGGLYNLAAGDYSFAAGRRAKANHTGAFVWADSQDADFPSAANNEFAVRALGGVRLQTGSAGLYATNGNRRVWITADDGGSYFEMKTADGSRAVVLAGTAWDGGGDIAVYNAGGYQKVRLDGLGTGGGGEIAVGGAGADNTSVQILGAGSGGAGQIRLFNESGNTTMTLDAMEGPGEGGIIKLGNASGVETLVLQGDAAAASAIELRKADGSRTILLDSDYGPDSHGHITTGVLQITGGSDLSEQFDINAIREEVKPGMVVCIDLKNPGQLVASSHAYDRTVAGVVSGAGGVRPGMLMGQSGSQADGQHPVALTGRVYCLADASNGAIQPGDLLTTSDTPGHGMKVIDYAKAQGAIIGKAMTRLDAGRGLVLVLVSLQ